MDLIWDGIREAFRLIFTGNGEVYEIVLLSLTVSGAATGMALVIGLSMASLLAFRAPPGRTLVLSFLNSGMALPPVVAGLVVAVMLWRSGAPGQLHGLPADAPLRHRPGGAARQLRDGDGTLLHPAGACVRGEPLPDRPPAAEARFVTRPKLGLR